MRDASFYRGKKILITGFTGFLGTEIARLLSGTDCFLTGLTRREISKLSNASDVLRGRLDDESVWIKALKDTDIVFHLAAQTSLEEAEKNPRADFLANVLPLEIMLNVLKKLKRAVPIIFAGTETQAGIPEYLPLDEKHPDKPVSVYDKHKLAAEQLLKTASSKKEIFGVSLRLCNLYGPGPDPSCSERGVLNRAILNALNGKNIYRYENYDFIRDYLFITDAAEAFLRAGENASTLSGNHFVIGSGKGWKFSEAFLLAAEKTSALTGFQVRVESKTASKKMDLVHSRNVIAGFDSFTKVTGWKPRVFLPEGLEKTAIFFLNQRNCGPIPADRISESFTKEK